MDPPQDDQRSESDLVHLAVERRALLGDHDVPSEGLEPEPLGHPCPPPRVTVTRSVLRAFASAGKRRLLPVLVEAREVLVAIFPPRPHPRPESARWH